MHIPQMINKAHPMYKVRTPIITLGAPGLGKSDMFTQMAQTITEQSGKQTDILLLNGTSMEGIDVRGIPVPIKREGLAPITRYSMSPIMSWIEEMRGKGSEQIIAFFDELPATDQLFQKAFASVAQDRMAGDYKLPDDVWVVAAGNRTKDRAGSSRVLSHVMNRMSVIQMGFSLEGWTNWAMNADVHPMVVAFANARPGLFADSVPSDDMPYMTPRSLTNSASFLSELAGLDANGMKNMDIPTDDFAMEYVAGQIGEGGAAELVAHLKTAQEIPSIEDIIKNPDTAKLPPLERMDAAYSAAQLVVYHAGQANIDPLFKYTERLPKELQTSVATQLVKKAGGVLMNSPAMAQWIKNNRALIIGSV